MEDAGRPLAAGLMLDRYELLCPIASGGMASVWLARLRGKRGFEKLFAIKTIKTEHITDPHFQEMFLDEARLASAIQHPNVAQIIDLGEQDNTLYTVMEWVDGESLAKIHRLALKRGMPLPLGIALRVMADLCAGLHAAHELRDADDRLLGVVHRDVSPENVLVTNAGAVKVIDFGVAKATSRERGDTRPGALKGKVRYMAPEQVNGLAVDRRADLWAVGICLYELVTGKEPFGDDHDVDVLRKLMGSDPAPAMDGLPERLVPVLPVFTRSLVPDPAARFDDAAAMRRALLAAMAELGLSSFTSEDVAHFLATNLADVAKKRRAQVARAVEIADARDENRAVASLGPAPALFDANDAFAPTLVEDSTIHAATSGSGISRDGPAPEAPDSSRAAANVTPDASVGGNLADKVAGKLPREARGLVAWGVAGVAVIALAISLFSRSASAPTPGAAAAPSSPASAATVAPAVAQPTDFEILDPLPVVGRAAGGPRAAPSVAPDAASTSQTGASDAAGTDAASAPAASVPPEPRDARAGAEAPVVVPAHEAPSAAANDAAPRPSASVAPPAPSVGPPPAPTSESAPP